MGVAEYVAAAAAVVSAGEVAEIAGAGCVVADGGFGIWLPVFSRRQRCDLDQTFRTPFRVSNSIQTKLPTISRRPSA
jgi:hypothetical protein